jgi:hypothetical protein
MTTNAACLVDDLGPLNRLVLWLFQHEGSGYRILAERTISRKEEKKTGHLSGIEQPDLFETLSGIDKCT